MNGNYTPHIVFIPTGCSLVKLRTPCKATSLTLAQDNVKALFPLQE